MQDLKTWRMAAVLIRRGDILICDPLTGWARPGTCAEITPGNRIGCACEDKDGRDGPAGECWVAYE